MNQHFGFREISRALLTITGIILLIIFGARAASQASSLSAVGGRAKHGVVAVSTNVSWLTTLNNVSYCTVMNTAPVASAAGKTALNQDSLKLGKTMRGLAANTRRTAQGSLEPHTKSAAVQFAKLEDSATYDKHIFKESVK